MKNSISDLPIRHWNDHNMEKESVRAIKRGHLLSPNYFLFPHFSPYFHNFHLLVEELMKAIFTTPDQYTSKSAVTHQDFITIFETVLSTLPPEPDVLRPPTYASKPNMTKCVFNNGDGDLMTGSEPITVTMNPRKLKQTRIAA
jgi:hypothetical protein